MGQHDFERANVYKINKEINQYIYILLFIHMYYIYIYVLNIYIYICVCKYMLIFRYRSFAYIG